MTSLRPCCIPLSRTLYKYLYFASKHAEKRRNPRLLFTVDTCVSLQAVKNVLSISEKEISKQKNAEKFEFREQNKNKTEAKWKYKVS